jgi:hypothetical protein
LAPEERSGAVVGEDIARQRAIKGMTCKWVICGSMLRVSRKVSKSATYMSVTVADIGKGRENEEQKCCGESEVGSK